MNILHINMNFDNSSIHYNIVNEMNKLDGIEGRIFCPVLFNDNNKNSNPQFLDRIRCLRRLDRFFYYCRNRKLKKVVRETYKVKSFNTILAHSLFSNGLLAMTISKKHDIPYSVIITNTDMNVYFKKIFHLKNTGIKIIMSAEKIIFTSNAYRDELISKYVPENQKEEILRKSVCIPFGVDNFWIENKKRMTEKNIKDNLKLLYVGKINENKNINCTIKACEKLINQGLNIKYTIIGRSSDKGGEYILKEICKYNFIEYIPHQTSDGLLEHYRKNDIFIMPSITESFGLVYVEAMSQGMPVVYSKGQGFDKQFENYKVGVSVNARSEDDVVSAVKYIVENYREMSDNAYRESCVFTWSNICKRFINELSLKE